MDEPDLLTVLAMVALHGILSRGNTYGPRAATEAYQVADKLERLLHDRPTMEEAFRDRDVP